MQFDHAPFEKLIKNRSGLVFNSDQIDRLTCGIQEMMSQKGVESHNEYFEIVQSSQKEFVDLVSHLTINETYFFREPIQMQVLVKNVVPEVMLRKNNGEKIKIMSAGCSTGAEPYSVVIALMEKYGMGVSHLISIVAFDIDNNAIRNAKEGIYGGQYFRTLNDQLKEKYFDTLGNGMYKIKPFIREMVMFYNFNLLNNYYPDVFREIDIIFYRNVSIYFEADNQKKIFTNLSKILNSDGYLIMSSTETLPHNINVLSLIEMGGIFLYHKNDQSQMDDGEMPVENRWPYQPGDEAPDMLGNGSNTSSQAPETVSDPFNTSNVDRSAILKADSEPEMVKKDFDKQYDKALSFAHEKKYGEAIDILDDIIQNNSYFIKAYTLKAGILLNLQTLEESKQLCLKAIQIDKFHLEGYLLLGLVARIENNQEEAVKRFKEALYLDTAIWLAHFHLAEIYQLKGENKNAFREFDVVKKLLEQGGFKDHGLSFFSFMFTPEQILYLCEHNLKKLTSE